ncbi:hypothetical protein [Paludisphaera mucosa]|uniref:Lipoprotein n=1 Tax=Paludisphaera mucosa TaxID=3030827 RepID=A0ABT6F4J1_9BACT|nr:hypothetical protein [Paludisphaera mucosa]MDG3002432.1 hypothetical protein [Paludisphaera mucosa]
MKRRLVVCASIALVLVVALGCLTVAQYRRWAYLESQYDGIIIGMTASEAEAVLGPGADLGEGPMTRFGPVMRGEKFRSWEDAATGRRIWVGIAGGRICDKWLWVPSL